MLRGLLSKHITEDQADMVLLKVRPGAVNTPLHQPSAPLGASMPLQDTVDGMRAVMRFNHGIGLAGIQVGFPYQVLIMEMTARDARDGYPRRENLPYTVIINPVVLGRAGSCQARESCLSIPGEQVMVTRSTAVRVRYRTLEGEMCTRTFEGWHARCFEHEEDHLRGVLITDLPDPGTKDKSDEELVDILRKGEFPEGTRILPFPNRTEF